MQFYPQVQALWPIWSEIMALRWSVVIPYYNEAGFLSKTVESLVAQTLRPLQLVFVDNASTDGSTDIIRAIMAAHPDIDAVYVNEPQPGQIHALQAGLARVKTEFVATCDADTMYPPHYLALCDAEFARHGLQTVAMMALGLKDPEHSFKSLIKRGFYPLVVAPVLRKQCHTGGYGHAFRTEALKTAGGYGTDKWRYVLFDHELMHRVFGQGMSRYHRNLYCTSSDRRTASADTRWSLYERVLYHLIPFQFKDWFFYSFLQKRFAARQMEGTNLRFERAWE